MAARGQELAVQRLRIAAALSPPNAGEVAKLRAQMVDAPLSYHAMLEVRPPCPAAAAQVDCMTCDTQTL